MPFPFTPDPGPVAPPAARSGAVRLDEDVLQLRRIGLELRLAFENDLIVVGCRVDRRNLARAKGVEQFLADLVDRNAVDRRLLAVDLDRHLRILDVEIGGDVAQSLDLGDLVAHLRRDLVQERGIARLQRVLKLALGNAAGDVDVLNVLEIHRHTGNGIGGAPQALNDVGRAFAALLLGFERDEHAAGIERRIRTTRPDRGIDVIYRLVRADDLGDLSLQRGHLPERNVGRSLGRGGNEAGILGREEALGNDRVEPERRRRGCRT